MTITFKNDFDKKTTMETIFFERYFTLNIPKKVINVNVRKKNFQGSDLNIKKNKFTFFYY